MTGVTLIPATVELLHALHTDRAAFGTIIGSPVPDGWPEFPESIEFTSAKLREKPDEHDWWMHFFLADGVLVGSGGFVGPPIDGTAEFGYEIAPEFRRQGLGRAAAQAMVDKAAAAGVAKVIAHTLAEENPSNALLRGLGFSFAGEISDPEEGTVWRWELPLPPAAQT
jgi:RimJ/RimL family protein N-acetyltransferase